MQCMSAAARYFNVTSYLAFTLGPTDSLTQLDLVPMHGQLHLTAISVHHHTSSFDAQCGLSEECSGPCQPAANHARLPGHHCGAGGLFTRALLSSRFHSLLLPQHLEKYSCSATATTTAASGPAAAGRHAVPSWTERMLLRHEGNDIVVVCC